MILLNKNTRKYLRDIRSLFPKFRKEERKYLNGFKSMIADCPNEESLSDRERLEAAYGTPEEVVRGFTSEAHVLSQEKQMTGIY